MYSDIANLLVFPFIFPSQGVYGWVAGVGIPLHECDAVVGDCSRRMATAKRIANGACPPLAEMANREQ
jgi:hypothetical protein